MNPAIRHSCLMGVHPHRPHRDNVLETINKTADVGDRLTAIAAKLTQDRRLTPDGQRGELAKAVKDSLAREYAFASRQGRAAPAFFKAQRAALGLPKVDRSDMVGELRRQEVRALLRSMPPTKRAQMANFIAADPEQAISLFDAPAFASGLDDASLEMSGSDTFENMRKAVISNLHGAKLEELDGQVDDYSYASVMAGEVRNELFKASGLSRDGFEAMMQPLEAEADR